MSTTFDDLSLELAINRLQRAIEDWAISKDIWFECGFKTYAEHVDGEPSEIPVVFVLYFSSTFENATYGTELWDLVQSHGFHFENADGSTLHFYPEDGPRCEAYANYFHWQWVCSLLQPDFGDVYEELYGHFARRPDDLHRLDWREFEILLARIFQTQGFVTELGPGRGDGGVDIRLLQRDPIGDILTLVQAKKYAPKNRIGLEAVAALSGVAGVEKAQRSIFVTTSTYQPVAKRFAARTSGALELYTSSDITEWCRTARDGIIQDKSTLVSTASVERQLREIGQKAHPRVVHAHSGYNITTNEFALILKETKHAALLMALPDLTISDDGYGQRGTEIPILDGRALPLLKQDTVWRARRSTDDSGRARYWDGRHLYHAWDGKPAYFDRCD
ncbi:restriction endonuclease [Bradyrhizobium sp. S3.5.5]|uniref:restriction endonuclease n=1 Tax=Bradyrhizobium sp. S3.5.5 TaxID=3156430 RepID=UPI003397827A